MSIIHDRLKFAGIETIEGAVRKIAPIASALPGTSEASATIPPAETAPIYKDPVLVAITQIGEKEVAGSTDNPAIMQYAKDCGMGYDHDEISWCSLFINWVMLMCGLTRSRTLAARDWLKIGIKITDPKMGDVVIFWRNSPSSWMGHVAIFLRIENGVVYCIGGNQSDSVSVTTMPLNQVLGYRRMEKI